MPDSAQKKMFSQLDIRQDVFAEREEAKKINIQKEKYKARDILAKMSREGKREKSYLLTKTIIKSIRFTVFTAREVEQTGSHKTNPLTREKVLQANSRLHRDNYILE